jgi:hypothetical protein
VGLLQYLVDFERPGSPARRLRRRRFELFRSLLDRLPRPVKILDVGGTAQFWRVMGLAGEPGVSITLVNLEPPREPPGPGVRALEGDARDLSRFTDRAFDVVFSNSLIEHVGDFEDQRRAAREMQRVGKAFFIQTPNRGFPLEPHFLFPFFQHLPVDARVFLLTRLPLGWSGRIPDPEEARRTVESVQLLDRDQFASLFPGAEIWEERVLGLTKSFVAYGGFASPSATNA